MAEWEVKRGDDEWPVADVQMLREWARTGRVSPTDYVYNPTLGRWIYASEVKELESGSRSTGKVSGVILALFIAAGLLGLLAAVSMLWMQ